ncbi:hypothetical protein AAFF_G00100950 [Aldrovandia affinis]|uniref:Uncharacterized protein n=1 Tax=Aldrovandia affinis TaxID=143900 RepID=A0AAD7RUY3_9TELE|nr:hypothetical protein AAFF_G00100950 [Aldrovandia affinis]
MWPVKLPPAQGVGGLEQLWRGGGETGVTGRVWRCVSPGRDRSPESGGRAPCTAAVAARRSVSPVTPSPPPLLRSVAVSASRDQRPRGERSAAAL